MVLNAVSTQRVSCTYSSITDVTTDVLLISTTVVRNSMDHDKFYDRMTGRCCFQRQDVDIGVFRSIT